MSLRDEKEIRLYIQDCEARRLEAKVRRDANDIGTRAYDRAEVDMEKWCSRLAALHWVMGEHPEYD